LIGGGDKMKGEDRDKVIDYMEWLLDYPPSVTPLDQQWLDRVRELLCSK